MKKKAYRRRLSLLDRFQSYSLFKAAQLAKMSQTVPASLQSPVVPPTLATGYATVDSPIRRWLETISIQKPQPAPNQAQQTASRKQLQSSIQGQPKPLQPLSSNRINFPRPVVRVPTKSGSFQKEANPYGQRFPGGYYYPPAITASYGAAPGPYAARGYPVRTHSSYASSSSRSSSSQSSTSPRDYAQNPNANVDGEMARLRRLLAYYSNMFERSPTQREIAREKINKIIERMSSLQAIADADNGIINVPAGVDIPDSLARFGIVPSVSSIKPTLTKREMERSPPAQLKSQNAGAATVFPGQSKDWISSEILNRWDAQRAGSGKGYAGDPNVTPDLPEMGRPPAARSPLATAIHTVADSARGTWLDQARWAEKNVSDTRNAISSALSGAAAVVRGTPAPIPPAADGTTAPAAAPPPIPPATDEAKPAPPAESMPKASPPDAAAASANPPMDRRQSLIQRLRAEQGRGGNLATAGAGSVFGAATGAINSPGYGVQPAPYYPQAPMPRFAYPQAPMPHTPHPQAPMPHFAYPQAPMPRFAYPQAPMPHFAYPQAPMPHTPHPQVAMEPAPSASQATAFPVPAAEQLPLRMAPNPVPYNPQNSQQFVPDQSQWNELREFMPTSTGGEQMVASPKGMPTTSGANPTTSKQQRSSWGPWGEPTNPVFSPIPTSVSKKPEDLNQNSLQLPKLPPVSRKGFNNVAAQPK